ncbi:MAG: hypothetical protein RL338_1848 [Chloroflexota bacterium]
MTATRRAGAAGRDRGASGPPRGRLVVHGHFHQPPREDPFTGRVPREAGAAPHHDWNTRIAAECYRPLAAEGAFRRLSFDVGVPLADWLAAHEREVERALVDGDGAAPGGLALAIPYHHTILPLATIAERRTELRWGLRSFEARFGRPARGAWLPETAVDLATLRLLADAGIEFTILAPWQAEDEGLDTRRPYRVELGDGRELTVVLYDAGISGAVSFDPAATADADRFARDVVATRLAGTPFEDGTPGLVLVATDGELYGHHQPFRDLFLARLLSIGTGGAGGGADAGRAAGAAGPDFEVAGLAAALDASPRPFPAIRIRDRTSWSCHHGVARWGWECPDARDGRWKAPLRAALARLAAGIDAVATARLAPAGIALEPLRDDYAEVLVDAESSAAFAARWLPRRSPVAPEELLALLEASRWRLAMFASDGWFWDDPLRLETKGVLRAAARAARLVDGLAGTGLERALRDDLSLVVSPSSRIDGAAIYRLALEEVGQPG